MTAIVGTLAARKFYTSDTLPISLSHICEINKIEVYLASFVGIAACYMEQEGRRIIAVSKKATRTRRRFSVAHELGHVILRHGAIRLMMSGGNDVRPTWQETQANAFAAELLMPKLTLTRMGVMTPHQIARLCEVSLEAAAIRAEQLGWQ